MSLLLLFGVIIIIQSYNIDACLPRNTQILTDSYIPVVIQALNHYKSQLQIYYPHTHSQLCKKGEQTMAIPQPDICAVESTARINLLLVDLQKEAAKQNLEHSQGLTRTVLINLKKTSEMTAVQQFHFILEKLQEEIGFRKIGCKISEFLQDLKNPNSKLFRNFSNVKPISYLI